MKKCSMLLLVAGMAALVVLLPSVLFSQWSHDPTVNTPVCTAADYQNNPLIVTDGAGGTIIAWFDGRSGYALELFAQRLDAGGNALWTADGVPIVEIPTADKDNFAIISDGAGGAFLSWNDYRTDWSNIYAQHINAAGEIQWAVNGVAVCPETDNGGQYPTMALDGAGGVYVVWEDSRGIIAQDVSASGAMLWPAEGVTVCIFTGDPIYPKMITDGAGGAIVCWNDYRNSHSEIYAQRFDSFGDTKWLDNGALVISGKYDSGNYPICTDGAGGAIITGEDSRSAVNSFYAQKIDNDGALQWTADGVLVCSEPTDLYTPNLISDGSGGAIIAYQDTRAGWDNSDIYVQRLNASGSLLWTTGGVVLCASPNSQESPVLGPDGRNGAIVAWLDYRDISNPAIYAQKVDSLGSIQWTANGVVLSVNSGLHFTADLYADGVGGAVVTWPDERTGFRHIYAQSITAGGTLGMEDVAWAEALDGFPKAEGMGFPIPTDAKFMTRNIAINPNGDVYVAGYGLRPSTKIDYLTVKYNLQGTILWAQTYDGLLKKTDKAYGLALSPDGGVFVTGESDGGATKADIATLRYRPDGTVAWVARWNNTTTNKADVGHAIAYDNTSNVVYVTGMTDNGKAKQDYITLAYNGATGALLWAHTYNGPGNKIDKAYALAVAPGFGVAVTGESDGGQTKADYATVFYDVQGNQVWASRYNGPSSKNDYAFGITYHLDAFYVTGASDGGKTKFDYATVEYERVAGAQIWVSRYNNALANKNDCAYDIAFDDNGDIYVTGASDGGKAKLDYTTVKYVGTVGEQVWVNRLDGGLSKADIARALVVNPGQASKIYVTGSSDKGAHHKLDYFNECIDASTGSLVWTNGYNGDAGKDDIAYGIAMRSDGSVAAIGGIVDRGRLTGLDFCVLQQPLNLSLAAPRSGPLAPEGQALKSLPQEFSLAQNYPNPFNPTTTIRFSLPVKAAVTLKVFNMLGQEVANIVDHQAMESGSHDVSFNASALASGIYFYRLDAVGEGKTYQQIKKMTLIK